ncbi:MAG TPA: hypothetical protein VHY22_04915 [Chthoniobacteraceae bacterium]|nr:hypothetical protein [Chthoniobacteraceae bacterium]
MRCSPFAFFLPALAFPALAQASVSPGSAAIGSQPGIVRLNANGEGAESRMVNWGKALRSHDSPDCTVLQAAPGGMP